MKATGIVRRIDDLGRVVLQKELRRTMEIKEGDPLEIFVDEGKIILQKYQPEAKVPKCAICGCTHDLHKVDDGYICKKHALAAGDAVMEG